MDSFKKSTRSRFSLKRTKILQKKTIIIIIERTTWHQLADHLIHYKCMLCINYVITECRIGVFPFFQKIQVILHISFLMTIWHWIIFPARHIESRYLFHPFFNYLLYFFVREDRILLLLKTCSLFYVLSTQSFSRGIILGNISVRT